MKETVDGGSNNNATINNNAHKKTSSSFKTLYIAGLMTVVIALTYLTLVGLPGANYSSALHGARSCDHFHEVDQGFHMHGETMTHAMDTSFWRQGLVPFMI